MSEVNVNVQVVQHLISQMKNTVTGLQGMQKELLSKYQAAGQNWRDQRYRELGDIISECTTAMTSIQMILSEGTESLKQLERALQGYEAVNLSATGITAVSSSVLNGYRESLSTHGLSEDADFGMLDQRTVQDLCNAIREMKEQFPEINLKFVGSLQARNIHLREKLTNAYLEEYRKYYKGATDEELMPYVKQNVEEDLRGFEPPPKVIAQSLFVENSYGAIGNAVMDFNGITINERFGANYDYFMSVREEDVRVGWKPQNCVSPKATVDHELGHQIAKYANAHKDTEIQRWFWQFSQLDREQKGLVLSGYAGESIHEFIAEAWSEYRNNPQCRECAQRVAKRMIELYEVRKPVLNRTTRG